MSELIEQTNGREGHVRWLQERIFRVIRIYGFSRREPRAGKLARGVPKRGRGW